MDIVDVEGRERGFSITWADDSVAEFPYIWLRDNDPDGFHPDTKERVFDLTSVPLDVHPVSFSIADDDLVVTWPQKQQPSVYSFAWLRRHQPGRRRDDPATVGRELWNADTLRRLPRFDASRCAASAEVLYDALRTIKRLGIVIVDGLEDSLDASHAFGELVGFRRRTNFGDMFNVASKPDPNNLAYTSLPLPLHTDLPNQELIPGYQLLHCFRNRAQGGESVFADGFQVCEDLRNEAPDDYEILKRVPLPWRFHDRNHDIRRHRPIISEREDGTPDYFVFNAHIADIPDMEADVLYRFYSVYQRLMRRIRKPRYAVHHLLAEGEMVVFDNARVLHGRTAFDAGSGERHLRGYYIERNEVDSRIRVLARASERQAQETND